MLPAMRSPDAGIYLFGDPAIAGDYALRNTLSGNRSSNNTGDGILVAAGQSRTLLDSNRTDGNTDDGIDVDSADSSLRRNSASRNVDLGIEAVEGVVDKGGNAARNNGDRR